MVPGLYHPAPTRPCEHHLPRTLMTTHKKKPRGGCDEGMPVCAIWRRESTTTGLESRLMRGELLQHHSRAASAFAKGQWQQRCGTPRSVTASSLSPDLPLLRKTHTTHSYEQEKKGAPGTAPCPSTTPIYMLSTYCLGGRVVPPTRLGPGSMRTPTRSHGSLGLLLPLSPTTLIPSCKG